MVESPGLAQSSLILASPGVAVRPVGAGSSLGVAVALAEDGPGCALRFSPRILKV